jgi:gas vesicle protein
MVMVALRERSKVQVHKVKGAALNSYTDAKDMVKAVQARERLTKVQQKLGDTLNEAQNTLQNSIQIAKAKMMVTPGTALDRGTRPTDKVSRTLRQASENVKELKETAQERHEQRVRKRRRARRMFRWGLITGIMLALLYTPKPGVEIRTKLAELWHTYRARLGL